MDQVNKDDSALKKRLPGNEAGIIPDLEKLHVYTHFKLTLADLLRNVRHALKTLGREDAEKQCAELMIKLAEDRFTLAVLGQFKRGKSSLMNAVIGRELLPTGMLPLTSVITKLVFGPTERMLVNHSYSIFPEEQPVSSLADYVTEKGNPGNAKKVADVTIELPVIFLQKGVAFVDTPGIGSAITENTRTTYEFLPDCDAVLFVTGPDTPMTSTEIAFLEEIAIYVNKLFFVINKIDLVADRDKVELIEFVTKIIRSQAGFDNVKIYPVSSRDGLAARLSSETALYRKSGLQELEDALVSFLTKEKTATLLGSVGEKALWILNKEEGRGAFEEAALQLREKAIREDKSGSIHDDPYAAASALKETRNEIEELYRNITGDKLTVREDDKKHIKEKLTLPANGDVRTTKVPGKLPQTDVKVDLRTRSCPVCQHLIKVSWDFYAQWQYLLGTDEKSQSEFAAAIGFCPLHTWQLLAVSSPYGTSIGYACLAEQIAYRIRANADKNTIAQVLHESQDCQVCDLLRQAEETYITQLAALISSEEGRNQYSHSGGVCLPHLDRLLNMTNLPDVHYFLLSHAANHFEQDAEDMRAYALKWDAVRRGLLNRDEKDAYLRAIVRMVGARDVCTPWPEDREI